MEQKNMVSIRQALNHCIKTLLTVVEAVETQENYTQTLVDQLKEFEAMKARLKELDPIMAAEKPEVKPETLK